jgi:hypothetical protein
MRRISSTSTWWHKRALPILSFGVLGLFALLLLLGIINGHVPVATLLIPLGMATFAYLLMRLLRVFSLVDEVWLDGEDVVVRNSDREDRIPLSNIVTVKASIMANPETLVLILGEPCRFGDQIVFSPTFRVVRFTRHPLADELTRRAQEARGNRNRDF